MRDGRLTPWDVQSRRIYDDAWPALYGGNGGGHGYAAANCLNPWDNQQRRVFDGCGTSPTLAGADGSGGRNPGGLVFQDAASQPVGAFCGGASAKARSIGYSEDVSPTLKAVACGFNAPCVCEPDIARTLTARGDDGSLRIQANFLSPNADGGPNVVAMGVHQNQVGRVSVSETAYTLNTNSNATGRNAPLVAHPDVAGTLCASGAGLSRPAGMASEPDLCVAYALAGNMVGRQDRNGPNGNGVSENLAFTLNASDVQNVAAGEPIPIHDRATRHNNGGCGNGLGVGEPGGPAPTLTEGDHHMVAAVDCRNFKEAGDCSGTLQAKNNPGWSLNFMNPVRAGYIVRRLTPTECERLQGFPDGWTALGHDGKEISDTRRYQMLGNSVAIPCVAYVLGSIAAAEARRG